MKGPELVTIKWSSYSEQARVNNYKGARFGNSEVVMVNQCLNFSCEKPPAVELNCILIIYYY